MNIKLKSVSSVHIEENWVFVHASLDENLEFAKSHRPENGKKLFHYHLDEGDMKVRVWLEMKQEE